MKYLFWVIFFPVAMNCQKPVNIELKNELARIDHDDQIYRELLQSDISPERKEQILKEKNLTGEDLSRLPRIMDNQDRENLSKIEKIIARYGYPGKSLVGEPENRTAWLVIQHSPKIKQYIPMIKKAAEAGELPFRLYAMMLDRQLMEEGKEQIYGTQGASFKIMKEGKPDVVSMIWPVKDLDKVNSLRKEAGFTETLEEYAKNLFGKDFVLKKYTLEEALKLQKQR